MKTLVLASAATLLALAAAPASATPYYGPSAFVPRVYLGGQYIPVRPAFSPNVSYGTGYRGVGSLTGGPSGGLPGRS